jgi:beta-1,4-N-acetylglucosaminyltransferase
MDKKNTVFITVGTTLFENLIKKFDEDHILKILIANGFTNIIYQIGKGTFEPSNWKKYPVLTVEIFKFKPSLIDDMKKAELMISHSGAGTLLECLRLKKNVIAVNNEILMGNHQMELIDALSKNDYIFGCSTLKEVDEKLDAYIKKLKKLGLRPYPEPQGGMIQQIIDEI